MGVAPDGEGRQGGLIRLAGRRPEVTGIVVLVAVIAAILTVAWFEPWSRYIEREVRDPPLVSLTTPPDERPILFARGALHGVEAPAQGVVLLYELTGGQRVMRFEGLRVEHAPEQHVYLSSADGEGGPSGLGLRSFHLGALKGNLGHLNYAISNEIDLEPYRSVIVWSRRFRSVYALGAIRPLEEA